MNHGVKHDQKEKKTGNRKRGSKEAGGEAKAESWGRGGRVKKWQKEEER